MCDLSDFYPQFLVDAGSTIYVRKLNSKRAWGPSVSHDVSDWAAECYGSSFEDDEDLISVYSVSTDVEMARVVVTMNAPEGRSRVEEIFLAWFTEEELKSNGLKIKQAMAETKCDLANRLHYEIDDDESKVVALIESARQNGKMILRFQKGKMRRAQKSAGNAGCHASKEDIKKPTCECRVVRARIPWRTKLRKALSKFLISAWRRLKNAGSASKKS